jgi:hypothetical protein
VGTRHACALGCEGIVSKQLGSHYRSFGIDHWLKIKNTAALAVKREAEEDWGATTAMNSWSDEDTDNPHYADRPPSTRSRSGAETACGSS